MIPHCWDKARGIVDAGYNDTTIIEELENQIKTEGAQKVLEPDY